MKINFHGKISDVKGLHWRQPEHIQGANSPSWMFTADFLYFQSIHMSKLTIVSMPAITSLSTPVISQKGDTINHVHYPPWTPRYQSTNQMSMI